DLIVCLHLAALKGPPGTYEELGKAVGLSPAEANQAVRRGVLAGLLRPGVGRRERPTVLAGALLGFLEHGVRHAFFAEPGRIVRGMPTAQSAPPLSELIASDE